MNNDEIRVKALEFATRTQKVLSSEEFKTQDLELIAEAHIRLAKRYVKYIRNGT